MQTLVAVPPAREIFCMDPATWIVERKFNTLATVLTDWDGKADGCGTGTQT
jgi:hypothetical protein